MDKKKEFEKKFGIEPHHEETCMKALDKLKRDMEKLKCDGGDGHATNPIAEKAITFFRYYSDITDWIDQVITDACKRQRESCAEVLRDSIIHNGYEPTVYGKILNAPSPTEGETK